MKWRNSLPSLVACLLLFISLEIFTQANEQGSSLLSSSSSEAPSLSSFVVRKGNKLYVDGQEFTLVGANIYWLGLDQNEPPDVVAYPTQFRIWDALETAVVMGANTIRAHTLGVSTGNPLSIESQLDVFNEVDPFLPIDTAIAACSALGLKLVIPLTDNYQYYHGGKHNFVEWHGLDQEDLFYISEPVIASFEQFIRNLLLRNNSITGVPIVEETTIAAWESGNELLPPANWTRRIASFVKSLDPNHLFLDGTYGVNPEALPLPEVDIYSDHFYPMDVDRLQLDIRRVNQADKVFFAGEFGWTQGNLTAFLAALEQLQAHNCYWSLFPHADNYGFVQHNDGFTMHWPGDDAAMQQAAQQLRNHALTMRGMSLPQLYPPPPPPLITSLQVTSSNLTIAWRGSAGAASYSVFVLLPARAATPVPLCKQCATDLDTPLTLSLSQPLPSHAAVSVVAHNLVGDASFPSNPVPIIL